MSQKHHFRNTVSVDSLKNLLIKDNKHAICGICCSIFSNGKELILHLSKSEDHFSFMCKLCFFYSTEEKNLIRHYKDTHNLDNFHLKVIFDAYLKNMIE